MVPHFREPQWLAIFGTQIVIRVKVRRQPEEQPYSRSEKPAAQHRH